MFEGGKKLGAGRPKKTHSPEIESAVRRQYRKNRTPLEHMLSVMNDPEADIDRRDRMAVAAAQYVHARKGSDNVRETRAQQAKAAATSDFAPAMAPRLVANSR